MKKLLVLFLSTLLLVTSACSKKQNDGVSSGTVVYTLNQYSTATPIKWNPHTWEMSGEDTMIAYLGTSLFDFVAKDTENLEYQISYKAATSLTDVTKDNLSDLEKYGSVLPEGKNLEDVSEGYVFEVKLNPNVKWQDGTQINADTYIYSMKQWLEPSMKNYRANTLYSGDNSLAGALEYFSQGDFNYTETSTPFSQLVLNDGKYCDADGNPLFFNINETNSVMGVSFDELVSNYNDGDAYVISEKYSSIESLLVNGVVELDENVYNTLKEALDTDGIKEEFKDLEQLSTLFYSRVQNPTGLVYEDTVGFYKVDDYTLRIVNLYSRDLNEVISTYSSPFLVYEPLYEGLKNTTGELVTTTYGTSVESSFSYGPYILTNFEKDKNYQFVKNPEYFAFEKDDQGRLVGKTNYEVDGQVVEAYQADKVNVTIIENQDSQKQAFLKGEVDSWSPSATDLPTYSLSDRIYKTDETYTLRLFFADKLEVLKEIDNSKGNKNSVVLSSKYFREALSLAIDRNEFITATAAFKPAFGVLNYLYYYDGFNDPKSIYRNTDAAKKALVDLYDVKYGDGTPYATLDDAHASLTGYNLTLAKELMQKAYDELSQSGVYSDGEIYIRIAYSPSEITPTQLQQVELLNKYVNAAIEGTGFGKVTFEAIGKVANRYDSTAKGDYAVGIGAWGGAAFYPFNTFRVYCDPTYVSIHEASSWDPSTYTFTLNVNGEQLTKTAQVWSQSLSGSGVYANAPIETKLDILAQLEKELLSLYHFIPLATYTSAELLSYKVDYYTKNYNIFYGFGGLELIKFNYTDKEWDDFRKSNELSYE